jgi:putative CocE/NonD family hydrolase
VHYYVLGDVDNATAPGNAWRTADGWPPFETEPLELYLGPGHGLAEALPDEPAGYSFRFDPADPCPTHGGANLSLPAGPFDQRQVSGRSDVICFATAPLEEPLEATGRFSVRLFVQTTAADMDFTAKLVDIYPDGREILLLDGIQRLKYRSGGQAAEPVVPGETAELTIDLWTFSIVFNAGHRIGVQISSSNYPRFEVNPATGEDFPAAESAAAATNTLLTGPDHPAALILPAPKG